jgi:hypothetical protein
MDPIEALFRTVDEDDSGNDDAAATNQQLFKIERKI